MFSIDEWDVFFIENNVSVEQRHLLLDYVERLNNNKFPVIFEFDHLSKIFGLSPRVLAALISDSSHSYRCFTIPKKRGGERSITSPYPALASCQKWILAHILSSIDPGPHVYSFRGDRSIIDNASVHLGSEEVLKVDMRDFFESIKIERIIAIFKRCGYSNSLSYHLAAVCCYKDRLPQGACTSPILSNIVAKRLDRRIFKLASDLGLRYSRYADDITVSGKTVPRNLVCTIRNIIEDEGFVFHDKKTVFKARGQKKIVTGLCISGEKLRVSKEYRRKFRQECFYFLKKGFSLQDGRKNTFDPLYAYRLIGRATFILRVEPENRFAAHALPQLKSLLQKQNL